MGNARGFTLIELLLATVLMTLLMVGVLAVITNLGRGALAAAGDGPAAATLAESVVDPWVRLLREDLEHADRIDAEPGCVTLVGYGALDPQSGARTHRPARVLYRLADVDGGPWLIREETPLDAPGAPARRELLGRGVVGFELVEVVEEDENGDAPPATRTAPPEGWRLRVWSAETDEPDEERTLAGRGSGPA